MYIKFFNFYPNIQIFFMQTTFAAFMKCLNEHACIHADMRTMSSIIRVTFMLKNYIK